MRLILRGRSTVRTVDSNSTNEGSNPYPAAKYLLKEIRHLITDNDKYLIGENQFIWGYSENQKEEPSFFTWDDIYIYYNKVEHKYYLHVDTSHYEEPQTLEAAWDEIDRLLKIERAFRNFLTKSCIPLNSKIICFSDLDLEADSLSELYTKFKIKLEGYKIYRLSQWEKPQN